MAKFMQIPLSDIRADKYSQVQMERSNIKNTSEVLEIEKKLEKSPENCELWMEKGLALAKQMLFREAIEAFSIGLSYCPFHALTYRHRGHRLISIRRFSEAAADFEISSRIDPSNWDTWYHLGLSYYLLGQYERAARTYKTCYEMSNGTPELVAVADWYWMTLMRLGRKEEADKLLENISENTDAGENTSYLRRLLMYKGIIKPEELIDYEGAAIIDLEIATQGYGLSNYYYLQGDIEKSNKALKMVLEHDRMWSAFGYLAAGVDAQKRGLSYEPIRQ